MNNSKFDLILNDVKKCNKDYNDFIGKKKFLDYSQTQFESEMEKKYTLLYNSYKTIFKQCITGNMDISVFTYMISKAKDINKNKISEYDASVSVGEKLVDTFVKPILEKEKEKETGKQNQKKNSE